jgi:short-subunit dehydrogenase
MLEMIEKFKPISPDVFANRALNSIAKNKAIIIVPLWWKLFWWVYRLFPSFGYFLFKSLSKIFRKNWV